MISLLMLTCRPGGLDIFAHSFAEMPSGADYEVVICDDFPGRVERGVATDWLRSRGINLAWHGVSKPKTIPETKGGICNAWNTALMHCRGEHVVSMSDYTWLPHFWLGQWETILKILPPKRLISGGGIVYKCPKPDVLGDVQTWGRSFFPAPVYPWVPWQWESFYCCHPMEYWLAANGMDERADHCHCWPVSSQLRQAELLGYDFTIMPEITAHLVDHREWCEGEKAPPGCGGEELWKTGGELSSLQEEPDWTVPCPNDFNLAEERRRWTSL